MIGRDKKTFLLLALWAGLFLLGSIRVHAGQTNTTPIFQFVVFYYEEDMEIRPGPDMYLGGVVHGNKDIYLSPGASLVFTNQVTSSGSIVFHKKAGDQESEGGGTTTFLGGTLTNMTPYYMPYYPSNFTNGAHGIVDVPPKTESATIGLGTNRLYHQVDMIVLVSNTTVTVKGGYQVNGEATVALSSWTNFISTNVTFSNTREAATIRAVTLDVAKLRAWEATNSVAASFRSILGRHLNSI